jgi:CheY-like chemotaxis protein
MLERRGAVVTVARTGSEGVAFADARDFDLALMDVQMPEMGGLEATAAIRKRERTTGRHLAIIAMTAHANKGDREKCFAAGMDGYLAKPIQTTALFEAIDAVLSRPPEREPGSRRNAAPVRARRVEAFDRQALMDRLDGDRELLAEIVGLFLETAPRLLAEVKTALGRGDGTALERAAHALKGAVANFGARAAMEAAQRMEQRAGQKDAAGARAAWAPLEKEMARLRKALARLAEEDAA